MNGKERVLATLNHRPTDRAPLNCWLYQKQFVEMLEAEYGTRAQFMDARNIDIFVGFVPWPNRLDHKIYVTEWAGFEPTDARDPKWLTHTASNPDFGGGNVIDAVEQHVCLG